ncbi:hypothetical protein HPB51_017442 [Rhipicephalus microplus]|uniref:Uncharacterized protein n=1 Tax=Rhipicephalus microplus TaxID=6941 RepID=A0A9J6E2M2_RHIMP|nr:hypothetical protein HPB51_017442 [Rhipicephalus microplus]
MWIPPTDLTMLEKTSGTGVRKNTKSAVNRVLIGMVPDRADVPRSSSRLLPRCPAGRSVPMDRRAVAEEERATRLAVFKMLAGMTKGEAGTDGVTEAMEVVATAAAVATVVVEAMARGTSENPGEDTVGMEATKAVGVATGSKTATEVAMVATEVVAATSKMATTREKGAGVEVEGATEEEGVEAGEEAGSMIDDYATLPFEQSDGWE